MQVPKARSPEELAREVEDYDTVLTVEASLVDSVNSYLEEEKVYTPMQLVEAEEGFYRKLFLKAKEELDMTWKQTSYLMENVISCWKHTGEPEEILEHPEFQRKEVKEMIELLRREDTPYIRIEHYEVDGSVAVLKEYQFNNMDRKVLPEEYDEVGGFKQEKAYLGEFNIFSSAADMAQSLRENIRKIDPEKAGIVLKPGTKYEPLIKSVLDSEGIPYRSQSDLSEDEDVRTFISLLETGLRGGKVRVGDVRPLLQHLGVRVSSKHENRKLENIQGAEQFKEFLNTVQYLDFGDAVDRYEELVDRKSGIFDVIEELSLDDKQVSRESINSLRYYLDSFKVGAEERSDGVLLADPSEVSNVDREHVFHIGMDTDWMREVGEKPWIDKQEEKARNRKDFTALIQSGDSYFMVQNEEMNEKITPCFYLNEIIDEDFTSFSDLPSREVSPKQEPLQQGFETEDYSYEEREVKALSQSGLNSFVQSPRLYYMDRLVADADQEKFRKGNLFHMYAEYHANNPSKASEITVEEVVDLMMEEIEEFADELDLDDLETEFRIGVENIRNLIESTEMESVEIEEYVDTGDENIFAQNFPGEITSPQTEAYFNDDNIGAKGKVDLIASRNQLVDYKSGRRKTTQKVVRKSHPDLYDDERFPDFQPLLYLTFHRQFTDGKIDFTLAYILNEIGNSVRGEEAETQTTVTYHPEKFQEKKASMELFEWMIKDVAKSNDRRKTLEKLGYSQYRNFMRKNQLEKPFNKEEALQTDFASEFLSFAKQEVGDYKYVEKGVRKAVKKLVEYRLSHYFREDADQMEEFLQEKLEEINRYMSERYPVGENPGELPRRDLILDD